ncbi:presenilin-associated rhomboid-like protein, mitochondrial isoform X3 [Syngnathus typhle]|uniref:presenilin-associated rhomboid-like protein, mitochondrial isoform X3 n=1 Tax=Syngnathus typhle TaxID=161592 RepID=UPI002A6AA0D5|nr:presenilin-associated rhomboid-like protein, mitochondrial isoform X3 [Syngnathus typhle]
MAAWRTYAVLLSRSGENVFRSLRGGSRWANNFQQRSGFRKVARKPESKNVENELGHLDSLETASHRPPPPPPPSSSSPRDFGRLVRPLLFTVGFTGCSFGSAAIWQYESLKSRVRSYYDDLRADWLERVRPQKRGDVRKEQSWPPTWWCSAAGDFRGSSAPCSKTLCSPMLLSTFSHVSFFHMAANMYVLWSFSTSAVSMLGREQFVAVYLSAGVISSFFSYVSKMATGRFGPSLGASGAIMTILAAVCTKMPEAKLAIIFLPMFTFTAANALKAIVAMDAAGLVLGWRFFDHAAHLGGAMFGIWYILFGHELIWKNREPFVKIWHELRTGRGGGNGGEPGGAA